MPFQISRSYLADYNPASSSKPGRAKGMAKGMISKDASKKKAIGALVHVGTGFGLGYAEHKYGMPTVPGYSWLSADLIGAVAIHALGFFGKTGKFEGYANDVANAALTYWAGVQGGLMAKPSTLARDVPGSTVKGEYHQISQGVRQPLNAEQLWATQFR